MGLWVYKEFEGFGKYRGEVIAHDKDMLDNVIYNIRYLDGDSEDLSLGELVVHLEKIPDDLVLICSTIIT